MRPRERETDASAGSMTLSILGWVVVALAVGAGMSALLLWAFGWPSLPRSAEFTAADTIELLKIVLAVIAGFGGVVLLSVNHRKQKVAEGDHRLALRNEEREKSKLLNERFAAAAEQLAHERAQVRLAGVYALAGLADDWDEGRQKCVEVLIAYLRLSGSAARSPGEGEEEVVDTIFRMFRERLTGFSDWQEVDFDFTGMKLVDADFSGFRFAGAVSFDRVVFAGATTSFAGTRFVGALRCHGTEFTARVTDFRDAWFRGEANFVGARFDSVLNLEDAFVYSGKVEFEGCRFDQVVSARDIVVSPGVLRFRECHFHGAPIDFAHGQFGDMFEQRGLADLFRNRLHDVNRGRLYIEGCSLVDSPMTLVDVVLANGRVVIKDLTLRGGNLFVKPTEMRHPSVIVTRIDAVDAEVDVPVPEWFWKGRAPKGAPHSSERDGHGGVGQDGADVREEL